MVKVSYYTEKQYFWSINFCIAHIKSKNGYPYLVRISETCKISKMAALISHRIPKFPKISIFPKIPKCPKIPKFPKCPKIPKFPDLMRRISENKGGNFWEILEIVEPVEILNLGNIMVPFLEILEFCAIRAAFLEILETCKEFSALQPQITASCPIVVLSWFKLSTKSCGI